MKKLFLILSVVLLVSGCQRIETGEVGLRVGLDKQTSSTELMPGSFNQTLIGDVLTFPIREIAVKVDNKTPLTSDNSSLADFDMTLIYNLTPTCVSDLWTNRSRSFHAWDEKSRDWVLMYFFVETIANNGIYKSVRNFEALKVADNRKKIEEEIKQIVTGTLAEEKLNTCIVVSSVQVRNIAPAVDIVASANAVVKASNDLKVKQTEVEIAKKEAERIAALNSNAKAIEYMNAQANLEIAKGIAAGKVNTVVIPYDFKGIVNVR